MSMFASRENSEAEQRAILAEIISTLDAVELKPPGIERARQIAQQSDDLGAVASREPHIETDMLKRGSSSPENLPLWDVA